MIILSGIKSINRRVSILEFTNEKNQKVNISVSKEVADTISINLRTISNDPNALVEVGNDETED